MAGAMKSANRLKPNAFTLALLAALLLSIPVLAQSSEPPPPEPLVLTDQQGKYDLGRSIDILEDPGGKLTIAEAASPQFAARFARNQQDVPNYSFTASAYWVRLRVRNESRLINQWWLEVGFPNIEYVDFYTPLPGGQGFLQKQTGALRPAASRDIHYPNVILVLPLPANSEQTIYLRFQTNSSMTLPLTLWSPSVFAIDNLPNQVLMGTFFGAMLILVFYNLFLLISLKEATYFYLVLILAGITVALADFQGFTNVYMFPGLYPWKEFIQLFSFSLALAAMVLFTGSYFEIKTRLPKLQPVLIGLVVGYALLVCLIPFAPARVPAFLFFVWVLPSLVFTLMVSIQSWSRGGHRQTLFFLNAWIGVIVGLMFFAFERLGFLPSNTFTEYSFRVGFVWMGLFWSIALADRIHLLKAETEDTSRALQKNQRQLTQTLEGLPLGVAVYGQDRQLTYLNPRAMEILSNPARDFQAAKAIGTNIVEAQDYFSLRVAGSDQEYPVERLPVWHAFEGESISVDDMEVDQIDRRISLESWASPVRDELGQIESVVCAFIDITQRKKDEAELSENRRNLERRIADRTALVNQINAQLHAEIARRLRLEDELRLRLRWLVTVNLVSQRLPHTQDLPHVYQQFTGNIPKLFGAVDAFIAELDEAGQKFMVCTHSAQDEPNPDWIGTTFSLPADVQSRHFAELKKHIIFSCDQFEPLGANLNAHFQATGSQSFLLEPLWFQENLVGVLGLEFLDADRHLSANDIAVLENIGLDIAHIKMNAQLFEQTKVMIAVEERNRLARDLHDSVTQVLFAASLVAELLPQISRRDPQKAQESLLELRRMTRGALAEMRTLLLELRPAALVNTPLGDLLAQLAEAVTSRTNLPFRLFIERIPSLPEDVHIGFYRIAQESLNNVVKHANASQVSVSLSAAPLSSGVTGPLRFELKLVINDNGRGFAPEEPGSHQMGLGIMRERAVAIHAALSVNSQPGEGTTVTASWLS